MRPKRFARFSRLPAAVLVTAALAAGCSWNESAASGDSADAGGDAASDAQGTGDPFVRAFAGGLTLRGAPYRFLGINAYQLAGGPNPARTRCSFVGSTLSDYRARLDQAFADFATMKVSALRFWAFQYFAGASGEDYTYFDEIVERARRADVRLVLTLENEWGGEPNCTLEAEKSAAWWSGGYLSANGGYALSYRDYVARLVAHFRDEPSILMWQLMNEADHGSAAQMNALVADVGGLIKAADPNHLLSLGTLNSCRVGKDAWFTAIHGSPLIDVVEEHDYPDQDGACYGSAAYPFDVLLRHDGALVASDIHKPWLIGETNAALSAEPWPAGSADARAVYMRERLTGTYPALGVSGALIWAYDPSHYDDYAIFPASGDPLVTVIEEAAGP